MFGCAASGCKVLIKTYDEKYVRVAGSGFDEAYADGDDSSAYDAKWTITFKGADKVQFKSGFGKYLVAETNGDANANRVDADTFETFTAEDMGNGKYAFLSEHGKYLVAESDGTLMANRNEASTQETFEIVIAGKQA